MVTERTRRMAQRIGLWALAVLLFVVLIATTISTYRLYGKMVVAGQEKSEAEKERDALIARNAELEKTLIELKSERGIEAEIRSRYPLVKPGEIEFIILDPENYPTSTVPVKKSWWERFFEILTF